VTDISSSARFERQVLLLGEEGQAAIMSATAHVDGPDPADVIAVRYARRAGFAKIAPKPDPAQSEASDLHEASAVVLLGARAALREILRVLPDATPDP
jgi:hypothetical protein